jgi:Zn-dependent protease with chaperone function
VSTATPATSKPVSASPELANRILQSLDRKIEPIKTTLGYRLAICVVAALMVLLPILYIALIALIGYGVYWHLVNNTGMLHTSVRGRAAIGVVFAFLSPAIVGATLVAFMLKPLFARRRDRGIKPKTVDRLDEPLLFDFIDRLCDAVGSPRPKSILLDDNVNAAAALTSGAWNPFRHDLMLVIGLPLVAGMTLKQFAGILAHEFGHFSQGAGMRLGGIINSVNRWFAFVVYQRDEWDTTLERWSSELDLRAGWIVYLMRAGVRLTRKILQGLMNVGHAMSCRLSREMEFDADRHEARLSGSTTFATTAHRLPVLMGARNWAIADLSESYREGRLVDDFFGLITYRAELIPKEGTKELIDEQMNRKTEWFDTHPCDAERIESALLERTPGLLQIDAPASVLFQDFPATCRAETLKFYRWQLGEDVPAKSLVSLDTLVARQQADAKEHKARERVLSGIYNYHWTLPLPDSLEPTTQSKDEVIAKIKSLRERIPESRAAHLEEIKKLAYNIAIIQEANLSEALIDAGFKIKIDTFTVPLTHQSEIEDVRHVANANKAAAYASLAPILQDLADRIVLPLQLLGVPSVAAMVPKGDELWEESRYLIGHDARLSRHRQDLLGIYDARELVRDLFKQLERHQDNNKLIQNLLEAMSNGVSRLSEVKDRLQELEYPFDHVNDEITVGNYLIAELPAKDELGSIDGVMTYACDEGLKISLRIVSRLCAIAETVETALGLPLGEMPPEDE